MCNTAANTSENPAWRVRAVRVCGLNFGHKKPCCEEGGNPETFGGCTVATNNWDLHELM